MLLKPSGWMRLALTVGLARTSLASSAADAVKIGLLKDASGNFALATIPNIHATELAVDEINAKGGILGRPVQLIAYDTQSDNTKFQELARRLVQTDKPDVIFGAFSSASREAIRPIMDRAHQLYWYDNQYEGGAQLAGFKRLKDGDFVTCRQPGGRCLDGICGLVSAAVGCAGCRR